MRKSKVFVFMYTVEDCPYCDKAKALLKKHGYTNINTQSLNAYTPKSIIEEFKQSCPGATTVPQIFIDGEWIGTYDKLEQRLK